MKDETEKQPYKGYTACTASPFCRYPGRIPMGELNQYVCVEHYSTDPARHGLAENWNLGLVRKTP